MSGTSPEIEKLRQECVDLQTEVGNLSQRLAQEGLEQAKVTEIEQSLDDRMAKFKQAQASMERLQEAARITSNDGLKAASENLAHELVGSDDENAAAIKASKELFGLQVLHGKGAPAIVQQWHDKNKKASNLVQAVQKRRMEQRLETMQMNGVDSDTILQAMTTSATTAGETTVPDLVWPEMEMQLAHYNQLRKVATILQLPTMSDYNLNVLSAAAAGAGVGSAAATAEGARQAGEQDLHIQAPVLKRQRISVKELHITHDLLGSNAIINFVDMLFEELGQEIGLQEEALMTVGSGEIVGFGYGGAAGGNAAARRAAALAAASLLSGKTLATTIIDLGKALGVVANPYRRGIAIFMHDDMAQGYLSVPVGAADVRTPARLVANPADPTEYRTIEGWRVLTNNSLQGLTASEMVANSVSWTVLGRRGYAIGEYVNEPIRVALFEELDAFQKGEVVISARMYSAGSPWNPAAIGQWKTTT